jgi:valyl-tRNA synthetase
MRSPIGVVVAKPGGLPCRETNIGASMDADHRAKLEARTRWEPGAAEARIFARWFEGGWFSPAPEGEAKDNYSIAIPPPNVTGALHMGHALNGSIQDTLIRLHRMRGVRTRWILGTDHAGIGTQAVVEKELAAQGTSRLELGREEFVRRVWEWREEYGSQIIEQFKRLGASADYADERFTMDDAYARAVAHVFVELHRRGLLYRDNYMVNWDPGLRSAISDLEVEQRRVTDTLYSIEYPLADGTGAVTVATVRPETMLADTAVAVHPDDERYRDLVGQEVVLPLVGRRLPVIADEHVDPEFGTGCLKITPGHDPNDFEIGRRHGLEEITVIGEDGRMTEAAGERFAGLDVDEASATVVAALRDEGAIKAEEPFEHDVPHSHRSGRRVEPLISLQWFCDMTRLAQPAIDVVREGRIRFHPEKPWTKVYLDWLEAIRPWCVSRQLWWGHRLPVYYCDPCEETIVTTEPPERCGTCGGELRRDEDVLDTWFSSALWPFATLGWPEETPELRAWYPTDVLVTARDIIFLWVARMVMMGLEFVGEVPFTDVDITSLIQAPDGRRMSKSLGTGIDPLTEIDVHGADALRFGLLAMSSTQDVRFSDAKVRQGRDLANKLWNASRLVLLNVPDDAVPAASPSLPEDRWILSRLQRTIETVAEQLDRFDYAHAALELYRFFWSEVCDWYLEIVKPRLYDGEADVASNLLHVLERFLRLAHPVIPFVTEEVWSYMPGGLADTPLLVSEFPTPDADLVDVAAEAEIEASIELTRGIRRWRDLAGVPVASVLPARVSGEAPHELVARLARLELDGSGGEALASVGPVELLAGEGLDPAQVRERVEARAAELRAEVERAERKLANEGFVAKAPEDVVAAEREKLESYRAELAELEP